MRFDYMENTQWETPEKEQLELKKGLPITQLQNNVKKFHVGDKVQIPTCMLPADSTVTKTEHVNAVIEAIYKHHIVFRLSSGARISLDYFDSLQVIVTEAFTSYSEEQQLLDLASAMSQK